MREYGSPTRDHFLEENLIPGRITSIDAGTENDESVSTMLEGNMMCHTIDAGSSTTDDSDSCFERIRDDFFEDSLGILGTLPRSDNSDQGNISSENSPYEEEVWCVTDISEFRRIGYIVYIDDLYRFLLEDFLDTFLINFL